jgi:hypothetical protein
MVKPCYYHGGFPFLYKKLFIMNVNPKHDVIIFNNDTKLNDFLVLDEEKYIIRVAKCYNVNYVDIKSFKNCKVLFNKSLWVGVCSSHMVALFFSKL